MHRCALFPDTFSRNGYLVRMERIFQIRPELGIFWRNSHTIQVGLDSRTGIVIEGLSTQECSFVCSLIHPHTAAEIDERARRLRLPSSRITHILRMLDKAQVLTKESDSLRMKKCVSIPRLDPLGASIALGLASSGFAVISDDSSPLTPTDHPLLLKYGGFGARNIALVGMIRAHFPQAVTHGSPSLAVVTGSRLIFPSRTAPLCAEGTPHLLIWAEEAEMRVGPLVQPGRTACARCLYCARIREEQEWVNLAPQAALAPAITPPPSDRELAAALAVHSVHNFLVAQDEILTTNQWRIPRGGSPFMTTVFPDDECGCTLDSLALLSDTKERKPLTI